MDDKADPVNGWAMLPSTEYHGPHLVTYCTRKLYKHLEVTLQISLLPFETLSWALIANCRRSPLAARPSAQNRQSLIRCKSQTLVTRAIWYSGHRVPVQSPPTGDSTELARNSHYSLHERDKKVIRFSGPESEKPDIAYL